MKLRIALNKERKCDWEKVKAVFDQVDADRAKLPAAILEFLSRGPSDAHDIMRHLVGRGIPASKGSVHKALTDLRDRLDAFYDSPAGFRERSRLEVAKMGNGVRSLRILDNIPSYGATAFWEGHLANGLQTELVVGGRPLKIENEVVIRDKDGQVLKVWQQDQPRSEETQPEADLFVPVRNVEAMLHLYTYFRTWHDDGVQPEPRICDHIPKKADAQFNRIILGTPFDNEIILDEELYADRRNHSCLFFNPDVTRFRKRAANGEHRVWVFRRWLSPQVETTIAASDSAALKAVCGHISSPNFESAVRNLWGNRPWRGFPPEFEMEFRVRLAENGNAFEGLRINSYEEMAGWGIKKVGNSGQPEVYVGAGGEWSWPW